jgi:RNA polymerase sigma-70 factor (ECF subfamily)
MSAPDAEVLQVLVGSHRRFLEFLERRTGNRADAEDLLQNAFVRTLVKGEGLREGESAVAWFYRILRNSLVDRQRTGSAGMRALAARARARARSEETDDPQLHQTVCRCVVDLLPALKAEYAELIRRVELEGESVKSVANTMGITANNAAVRLHRARKALFKEVQRACRTCAVHGCLDCTCGPASCC